MVELLFIASGSLYYETCVENKNHQRSFLSLVIFLITNRLPVAIAVTATTAAASILTTKATALETAASRSSA